MSAYEKKKQPDKVRRDLLDAAARVCAERGPGGLTLQAVAEAAGVTKGGLLHHFQSKQELIAALFVDLLDALDADLDARMARDPVAYGSFTRAYVDAMMLPAARPSTDPCGPISVSIFNTPDVHARWNEWLDARLLRHADTDSDVALQAARLAADGVWLADLIETVTPNRSELHALLLDLTRKPGRP